MKHFVSQAEVARRLKLSRPTVLLMLKEKAIPGLTTHWGLRRIDRKTFEEWLDSKDR